MSMMMLAGLFLWLAWSPSDDSSIDPDSTIPSTETRSARVSGSRALTNTNSLPVGPVLVPSAIFDPSQHPDWRLKTLSIEDIRVGMRVPALNPEGSSFQNDTVAGEHRPEQSSRRDAEARRGMDDDELGLETAFGNPDPETWRVFRLEVEKQDQSGALEVTLLRPADWLVEQQQSTALLALLAELQDSQPTAPPPATADFVSFVSLVVQSPSLSIFQRGTEKALDSLDHVLAVAPLAGRLGAQGLTSGALESAREWLVSSLVKGVEGDLAWQDQVAAVLDGSAAGSLIWLEMPELGAVGLATVKSIEPCPTIKSGLGRIVTATFRHASAEVLDLTFSQASVPSFSVSRPSSPLTPDPSHLTLGVTAAHPFWSIDRESFVPAGELQPQEQVIGIDGEHFRLTSITPRAGPETVYNLEVALDHVYYVGQGGVLVHNAYLQNALNSMKQIYYRSIKPSMRNAKRWLSDSRSWRRIVADRPLLDPRLSREHIVSRNGLIAKMFRIPERFLNGKLNSGLQISRRLNNGFLAKTGIRGVVNRSAFYGTVIGGPLSAGYLGGTWLGNWLFREDD